MRTVATYLVTLFSILSLGSVSALQGDGQTDTWTPCTLESAAESDTTSQPAVETSTGDGHLGGSLASFDAKYGEPESGELFIEYEIEGCGPVLVSDFEENLVTSIGVFAPRAGEDQDYNEPDDADWTIEEAMTIAEAFLPADAVFDAPTGDMNPPEPGMLADYIEVTGTSDTLLQNVPAAAYEYVDNSPTYGGFSYVLFRTTSGDVSWIDIQLQIED